MKKISDLLARNAELLAEHEELEKLPADKREEANKRSVAILAEIKQNNADIEHLRSLQAEITRAAGHAADQERLAPIAKPSPSAGGGHATPAQPVFRNIGEQLQAVYTMSNPIASTRAKEEAGNKLEAVARAQGSSTLVGNEGGFVVQKTIAQQILQRTNDVGILYKKVTPVPLDPGTTAIDIPVVDESSRVNGSRFGGITADWVQEGESVSASRPKLRMMNMKLRKIMALWPCTSELLKNARAMSAIALKGFSEELAYKRDEGIFRGTAAKQPRGILSSGSLITVPKKSGQANDTVIFENINSMFARMYVRSLPHAEWYLNQAVLEQLPYMKLDVGTGGSAVYLPPGGASSSPFGSLYGRPINVIEQASALGDVGDIVFADFGQYGMIEDGDIETAESMHVYFSTDENVFRLIMHCDGEPIWKEALTPAYGNQTTSPFVTLAAR